MGWRAGSEKTRRLDSTVDIGGLSVAHGASWCVRGCLEAHSNNNGHQVDSERRLLHVSFDDLTRITTTPFGVEAFGPARLSAFQPLEACQHQAQPYSRVGLYRSAHMQRFCGTFYARVMAMSEMTTSEMTAGTRSCGEKRTRGEYMTAASVVCSQSFGNTTFIDTGPRRSSKFALFRFWPSPRKLDLTQLYISNSRALVSFLGGACFGTRATDRLRLRRRRQRQAIGSYARST